MVYTCELCEDNSEYLKGLRIHQLSCKKRVRLPDHSKLLPAYREVQKLLKLIFEQESTDGVILVDARNSFN